MRVRFLRGATVRGIRDPPIRPAARDSMHRLPPTCEAHPRVNVARARRRVPPPPPLSALPFARPTPRRTRPEHIARGVRGVRGMWGV